MSDSFDAFAMQAVEPIKDDNPLTFADAKASPYWPQWKAALAEERKSLEERNVWVQVQPDEIPKGAKLLQANIVYKQKRNAAGEVNRFKCR
eukprot:3172466-Rhodomonas_salina.1